MRKSRTPRDKPFAIHPGEILREEFMKPLGLSSYQLAKELHLTVPRVNEIVRERRAITARHGSPPVRVLRNETAILARTAG